MTLFDGITSRLVDTERLKVTILERTGDDAATPPERTVVLIHTTIAAHEFWQELMEDLPGDLRVVAVDLTAEPSDAADVHEVLHDALRAVGIELAHLVGWDGGGEVVLRYAREHAALSLTVCIADAAELPPLTDLTAQPSLLWINPAAHTDAIAAYRAAGGAVVELNLDDVDADTARPAAFRRGLLSVMGYIGDPASPAPPTEAIIISSSD